MLNRPAKTHIFIIDGTLSRLVTGHESNAGLLYKLLIEAGPTAKQTVAYDPGIQGHGLRKWLNVAAGLTINQSILAGYSVLCSRYQPGDKIMIFGYSRGAYAARSLAGFISSVGLLMHRHATHRRIVRAFRYYESESVNDHARTFSTKFCHRDIAIEVVGVWDTVRALGLPYPILSRLAPMATEFHDHNLSDTITHAFQALALDETRTAYAPLPWKLHDGWKGHLEQVWFAGAHSDVGGQISGKPAARALSNIPFIWMVKRAERCGMALPADWQSRFPTDSSAPMIGNKSGWGKFFILRRARIAGACGSESEHTSVTERKSILPKYKPIAQWVTALANRQNR